MKKLAIFVEGQTEQILLTELIKDIAGGKPVNIVEGSSSGKKGKRQFRTIKVENNQDQYYVMIMNCGQDETVKSDIKERYEGLKKEGYEQVFGVRDVYPIDRSKIAQFREGLARGFSNDLPVLFILSVMELEAWLIAEYNHFPKIHHALTMERIKRELGIDLINDDLSKRERPAKDLENIYWLENKSYDKSKSAVTEILSKLDKQFFKNTVSLRFPDLGIFYQKIDLFLSPH